MTVKRFEPDHLPRARLPVRPGPATRPARRRLREDRPADRRTGRGAGVDSRRPLLGDHFL